MIIGGLQKFSLLDYPEHIAAIIFTQGCNFRCQFCYNPMLVWPVNQGGETAQITAKKNNAQSQKGRLRIKEGDLFDFLAKRAGKLEAVVITGGEPTLQPDLPEFIKKIRKLGYKIKLDTNGTNPTMLRSLIKRSLIDYLAMDIKGPLDKYEMITGVKADLNKIKESIKIIMKGGLPYEFRTTLVPELFVSEDIGRIGRLIKGADKWYLQKFKADTSLVNPSFERQRAFSDQEMAEAKELAKKYVKICEAR